MQVAGATGKAVVDREEPSRPVRAVGTRMVGHRRLGDVDVVRVAPVLRCDPREQRGGERRQPLLGPRHGGGQQDTHRLGGQLVGKEQRDVLAIALLLACASGGRSLDPTAWTPQQVVRAAWVLVAHRFRQRVLRYVHHRMSLCGRSSATGADVEGIDANVSAGQGCRTAPLLAVEPQIERPDLRLAGEVHPEHSCLVPPGTGGDPLGVDVDRGQYRIVPPVPLITVVSYAGIVPLVTGDDPPRL